MTNKLPDRDPAIRTIAMPADANANGDIFGGWLMAQMDLAAAVAAKREARGRVATVAVDAMAFHSPVLIGDLLSCYAEVVRVGRTSMRYLSSQASARSPIGTTRSLLPLPWRIMTVP